MHEIRTDPSQNRLYFTLGFVEDRSEMETIIVRISDAVKELKPGFTCLSDLRQYRVNNRQDEEFMREIQEILWDAGIHRVARISSSPKICNHFHFEKESVVWPGYSVTIVSSFEEGESFLNDNR